MTDRELAGCALLPCPFCGGEARLTISGNSYSGHKCVVRCQGCRYQRTDAALRNSESWLRGTAIAAWNRRTPSSDGDGRDAERYRRWRLLAASGTMSEAVCEMMIAARTEDDIDAAIDADIAAAAGGGDA